MINAEMRFYNYYTFGNKDEYGQQTISPAPIGTIKMALNITSQAIQDNILYKDCNYIGLTQAPIDESYVILNGTEFLKVLYVNPKGRFKQVFLTNVN